MKPKFLVFSSNKNNKLYFDKVHMQLLLEQKQRLAKLELEKFEAELEANTKKAKRRVKKMAKKAVYDMKYLYVFSGHFKNEVLGSLTIFNANRAKDIDITRFVRYAKDDHKMYLDIYQKKDRDMSKKAKVFVYIHGGGWIGGFPAAREGYTTQMAENGYFVISLYYGEAPEYAHPKMIQNIYKAFAWLKENEEKYNIDTEEIFIGGESAGAHLSAMAGAISTNEEYKAHFDLPEISKDQKIAGLVLICGVYDLEKLATIDFKNVGVYTQSYCGGEEVKNLADNIKKEISPIYWVNKDFPPTYAISGANDKLAVLTFDFVEKLFELGVNVEHYHGKGKWAVHAYAVSMALRISREAFINTIKFLKGI